PLLHFLPHRTARARRDRDRPRCDRSLSPEAGADCAHARSRHHEAHRQSHRARSMALARFHAGRGRHQSVLPARSQQRHASPRGPAVAAAVAQGLLAAGLPPQNIIIWDKNEVDLRDAGIAALQNTLGIRVEGSTSTGYDPTNYYDTPLIGNLVWGDFEFGKTGE